MRRRAQGEVAVRLRASSRRNDTRIDELATKIESVERLFTSPPSRMRGRIVGRARRPRSEREREQRRKGRSMPVPRQCGGFGGKVGPGGNGTAKPAAGGSAGRSGAGGRDAIKHLSGRSKAWRASWRACGPIWAAVGRAIRHARGANALPATGAGFCRDHRGERSHRRRRRATSPERTGADRVHRRAAVGATRSASGHRLSRESGAGAFHVAGTRVVLRQVDVGAVAGHGSRRGEIAMVGAADIRARPVLYYSLDEAPEQVMRRQEPRRGLPAVRVSRPALGPGCGSNNARR